MLKNPIGKMLSITSYPNKYIANMFAIIFIFTVARYTMLCVINLK